MENYNIKEYTLDKYETIDGAGEVMRLPGKMPKA